MYLYQSNRLENLFSALCETIAHPAGNPLSPETIVVQNPGMSRWLSQNIALQTGIAANLAFPLPASFIWDIFGRTLGDLPDLSEFDRTVLLWRVLNHLDELLTDSSMQEIASYLQDDEDGGKKFQLAGKITDLFDQYLVYRPEMLLEWEKGKDNQWQAVLWRKLTDNASDAAMHRAALLRHFIEQGTAGKLRVDSLPKRVCLFGINSLAPAYLEVISRISEHIDIHIFHLSPCCQAWDDIMPERLLAMKRQTWRSQGLDDISEYFTVGNPLLASMGAIGQEFFCQLMQINPQEIDLYKAPETDSLLAMIQEDLLDLNDRGKAEPAPLPQDDHSITFHCCHSATREVQALHDRLLDLFADDSTLKPADILVMAPDINQYAPAVAGVFGSARLELRIPWSIADQSKQGEQPVIDGFSSLLDIAGSRFTAPELVALLENSAILRRFDLADEDFGAMRSRIKDSGIRWGLDTEQRQQQFMDDSGAHTWEFGLDRLLLGYITGSLDEPFQEIMPCSGMINDTDSWLGNLTDFIQKLQNLHRKLRKNRKHTPAEWSKILLIIIDDFFDSGNNSRDEDGLLVLRKTINDFEQACEKAGFTTPVGLAIIRNHFTQLLAEPAGGQSFLSGRVTFCNMVPMRSVPFKIIWLLGMNDTDYPRSQRPPGFDLIAAHPRIGDRSRRDDDRYLFLEALLSTRSRLAISWIGRSQQDNTEKPPSVVVAELRDYIDRGWQAGANDQASSDLLTVEYPLQPFSRHCFDGNPKTASYSAEWLPASDSSGAAAMFSSQPLPALEQQQQQVDISELARFWNHPVRYFLTQRLGLQLRMEDEQLPESEAFSLDHLQQYLLKDQMMASLLNNEDPLPAYHRLQAAGELPGGEFGFLLFKEIHETSANIVQELKPLIQQPIEPVEINLTINDHQLTGWLSSLYNSGRITFRPAKLKPKDMLRLWIHHLVLLLLQPANVQPVSIHAATDKIICFKEVDEPQEELAALMQYFQQGLSEPLHFYPKTSHAWAKAKSETAAIKAARGAWYSGYNDGEEKDTAYDIALRGHDPLDARFEELAALFYPIINSMENYD